MVQSRKEPTISSGDLSLPMDDDLGPRSRQQRSAAATGKTPPSKTATVVKAKSPLAGFAVLLALVALGIGGFATWQFWLTSQQLAEANGRLTELENRLALSDDESTQSVTALQAALKQALGNVGINETEIRKLWDTRNVNRKAINDNESAIVALGKEVKASLGKLDKSVAALQSGLQSVDGKVAANESQVATLKSQMAGLKDLSSQLSSLKSQLATIQSLNSRVTSNEEAIEAIDAYRLNINRQLLELQQRVNGAQ
ncbi:hypothetical protein [Halioxenophilus sp. WMMB6]|uniref:hypothetical protein n=1 Tax=Halioxenophilus sp. WMMB6 TaxID=3073815 RepID=UPI00295E8366|nr:hypothetical protein [Halioxenophilus sp. WMMB6]